AGHPGLEISDRGDRQVNIVPPPGNDRIPVDPGVVVLLKEREVSLPHLVDRVSPEHRVADEIIGLAGGIATDLLIRIPGPECCTAPGAYLAGHPLDFEIFELIFVLEHG